MKQKTLYLTCGIPASGKSSWCAKQKEIYGDNLIIISRDNIRFSMLKDGESYFAHEDSVFNEFIRQINCAIADDVHHFIIADATHINRGSRAKVLNRLNIAGTAVVPVNFDTDVKICLERNEKREGLARVPDYAIANMYKHFCPATAKDNLGYNYIIEVI